MDFAGACALHITREQVRTLGAQMISDDDTKMIHSIDDVCRLVGSQAGGDLTGIFGFTSDASRGSNLSSRLHRYFLQHILMWPNTLVRVSIPKKRHDQLVDINASLRELRDANPGVAVYRVGIVRAVRIVTAPAKAQLSLENAAGIIDSVLFPCIHLDVDFGDCRDSQVSVRILSNEKLSGDEFSILTTAVLSQPPPPPGMGSFVREDAGTTLARVAQLRHEGTSNTRGSFFSSVASEESLTLQRVIALEQLLGSKAALDGGCDGAQVAALLHGPELRRLALFCGDAGGGPDSRDDAQMREREVMTELSTLKRARDEARAEAADLRSQLAAAVIEKEKLSRELNTQSDRVKRLGDALRQAQPMLKAIPDIRQALSLHKQASGQEILDAIGHKTA